jgi:hypothetical protein
MVSNPHIGQRVQLWYAAKRRQFAPHHGEFGRVVVVGKGKPRNHGVELQSGDVVAVPAGNLKIVADNQENHSE